MVCRMKTHPRHSICLMGKILILLIAFTGWRCATPLMIQTSIPTYPTHPLVPSPEKMVIANAYDVKPQSFRDNKEKQFIVLMGYTMRHADMQIEKRSNINVDVVEVPIHNVHPDSARMLMALHDATHAIHVTFFNAYFDQTRVDVSKDENGKSKVAYYDLVVEIGYLMQNQHRVVSDTLISMRRFHSSRSVISGLLAVGPNIVSNTDDVVDGVHANVDFYLKKFFPGIEPRTRPIFITKEFKEVGTAVKTGNYESALDYSENLILSSDNEIAARALYNCAVLSEYLARHEVVKSYLKQAMARQYLMQASEMLDDYR